MTEQNIPPRWLYGQKLMVTIASVNQSKHREPKDYDFWNRPVDWVTITEYSFRFTSGGFFQGQQTDCNLNVHRGDLFEAYTYDNRFTYLKNTVTGDVFYDNPVLNSDWVEYQKQEENKQNQEWNKLPYTERLVKLWFIILPLIVGGIWLSHIFRNAIPFFICSLIGYISLLNKKVPKQSG